MTTSVTRTNRWRLAAILTLSLALGYSAASMDAMTAPDKSESEPLATARPADPATARLARQFEPRVVALLQRIAIEKRISRNAIEAELGIKLSEEATRPGRPKRWKFHGLFSQEHGFLIELQRDGSDANLVVSASADSPSGCHLDMAPVRKVLVEKLHFVAHDMGQGGRPFTLLREKELPLPSVVTVRVFDKFIDRATGERQFCIYRFSAAAPGG